MPDAPKPAPRISDPALAADISPADVDAALAAWRKDAPTGLRELLSAEQDKKPEAPPI